MISKPSNRLPTLKTLAANAMVKDKVKYFEELSDKQAPTIRLQNMRDEELDQANLSKYTRNTSFQNLFHYRLQQMPGKRERARITINAVIEHTIGNRTEFTNKTYGPFKMEVPKLSKPDMYKFWILFTVGSVDRDNGQYSGRYSDRQSVDIAFDSRSTVDR